MLMSGYLGGSVGDGDRDSRKVPKMKIKVDVTLDIDAKAWADEYGLDHQDVRADVKQYVELLVREQILTLGLLNT